MFLDLPNMDMVPYVDALLKEYLLFRGFTATFQSFSKEVHQVRHECKSSVCLSVCLSVCRLSLIHI